MNKKKPKVSILCPSFNHEKFVGTFIDSVLAQTEQDFELIIIDDCSTDRTAEIISAYDDQRINLRKHEFNKGVNAALNEAHKLAQGEYCLLIASDDALDKNYIKISLKYLIEHPNIDVYYSSLALINDHNQSLQDLNNVFVKNNSDRFDVLLKMFFIGNVLLSPGMVVKKTALDKIMPLDVSSLQYQDCIMHILLMLNGEIYQSTEKLVNYRLISNNMNTSARTAKVTAREALEEKSYMDAFLNIKDVNLLNSIFGDRLAPFGEPTAETIPYFLARLALMAPKIERKLWGYQTFMEFYNRTGNQQLLYDKYKFTFKDYLDLIEYFN